MRNFASELHTLTECKVSMVTSYIQCIRETLHQNGTIMLSATTAHGYEFKNGSSYVVLAEPLTTV